MRRAVQIGKGRHVANRFVTHNGLVAYWQLIDWSAVAEKRGIIKPLDDGDRAAWAVRVLTKRYPDRTYDQIKMYAPLGVTVEQMQCFAAPVIDDVGKLETAQNLGLDWYD